MRLLFDENLSHRLARELSDLYPDSAHVRDIGLLGAEDVLIWDYAAGHDFMLVLLTIYLYKMLLNGSNNAIGG